MEKNSFYPQNRGEWRKWLELNHRKEQSVWLIYDKISTGKANLSWSEAVDEALCFGWIDSLKKTIDERQYMQVFSKRKPKSTWSKVNKEKVELLTKTGKMKPAGLAVVELAKENGSWDSLNEVENLSLPDELKEQFRLNPKAKTFYENLSKSVKKGLLYWVISAKRETTREKRIKELIENALKNQKPKAFRN